VLLSCHVFGSEEIEFDLDPGEVAGPAQLEGLVGAGDEQARPVDMENMPEANIFHCLPVDQRLEWVPRTQS